MHQIIEGHVPGNTTVDITVSADINQSCSSGQIDVIIETSFGGLTLYSEPTARTTIRAPVIQKSYSFSSR